MGIARVSDSWIVKKKGQLHSIGIARRNVNVRTGEVEGGTVGVPVSSAWLAATFPRLADTHQVPSAQLAVHRGGVTVTVEVGELDHGVEIPVTAETAFPIGSISKAWTATRVMILAADGDRELNATLDGNLPELDDLVGVPPEDVRGWSRHTTGPFRVHLLPGDHFFVNSAHPDLLRLVASKLESAQGGAARVIR
jgi:CubicO group peptidase (beta-lactamase class C family)